MMTAMSAKVEKCYRCSRPNPEAIDGGLPDEWEVVTDGGGEVVGVICEECITPAEQQAMDEADMELIKELGINDPPPDHPHLRIVPDQS
jgi:hypothetical protein